VPTPHPLHLVVLVLGVLFSLRHMDVGHRGAEQHPEVEIQGFTRWKLLASRAYRLGLSACFGKVLLDFLFAYLFRMRPPPVALAWGIGLTLDIGWAVLVGVSFWRIRAAHKLARELGIELGRRPEA